MSEPFWSALGGGAVDYEGTYNPATQYAPGDVVRFGGVDYLCVNPTIGVAPTGAGTYLRGRLPIRLRVPRSSTLAGNTAFSVSARTAHDFAIWEFGNNVEGRVYGYVILPPVLSATPRAEIRLAMSSAVASGNMRFRVATKCVGEGQSFDPATLTAEAYQAIASTGIWVRTLDPIFVLTEPIVARGMLLVEITRDGANALDTAEGSAFVVDAHLEIDFGS